MAKAIRWEALDNDNQVWTAKYKIPSFIARSLTFLSKDKKVILVGAGAPMETSFPIRTILNTVNLNWPSSRTPTTIWG